MLNAIVDDTSWNDGEDGIRDGIDNQISELESVDFPSAF